MTRQDLDRLLKRLRRDGEAGVVKLQRVRCDTVGGRMVCEWEAPDREVLVDWLADRNIRFRSSEEWCMRVQLDSRNGSVQQV
jgi:hypothetical protein